MALKMLPHMDSSALTTLRERGIVGIYDLLSRSADDVRGILKFVLVPSQIIEFMQVCN